MTSQRWMLTVCLWLASVLGTGESVTTTETQKYTCRTFGSGVVQPFNSSGFYVRSTCPFTLTRFTHNRVECDITVQRGDSGLLTQVEIIINKIRTVLQNGSILVERKSVSLPYDHTYQHIFHYGIYTKLRSSLLPLSVTWHNAPGGIDSVWVEVEQELSDDMTGLCGKHNVPGNKQQLISGSVLPDDTCQIRDPVSAENLACRMFFSYTLDCLQARLPHYIQLCDENIYNYEMSKSISCAFFKDVILQCGDSSYAWNIWRSVTGCANPSCPGDLIYVERGPAFIPSCSNPNPRLTNEDLISSCVCPMDKVLNDHEDGFHCVSLPSCPCVFAGKSYSTGDTRTTKCQSCMCNGGRWQCSENFCPARCVIEGQFVTTFDGKQYAVPGKCTYVASQGLNWTITIQYSEKAPSLKTVTLQLFQDTYVFSHNMVKIREEEITELHQSDHALVFWQSSMYVQVHTSFGMKIQVQMSPEIQLYITPPANQTGLISGLCGNGNSDTTDDFTTSSGIIENSAQPFAQSWSVDTCPVNIPTTCINTDNEIFADEKCSVLNNPAGVFAKCHGHIPTDHYHTACIQRTCNCGSSLQQCLCVALGSYAQACASLGVVVGDWRKATNCTVKCQKNQEFSYSTQACNHTCRSLSGPDPRCRLDDAPVEGCGCPEGTHLNQEHICTPKADCVCHYYGGTTPPGPVVIDGRKCSCENGELQCSKDCGCRNGTVCVHCAEHPVNTAQKTCDSLSKPMGTSETCDSGCYCPHDQYEDHRGNCVSLDSCTCVYSGKVFSTGQRVQTNCKTCTCGQGQWHCKDEPCPGKCQVYGNGHYQTFDSKWYRFDGHCQYTLVQDDCGNTNGTFSVRVESVPCCDEALTCSRSIIFDLQGIVTLTMSDMKVTRRHHDGWTLLDDSLYSTHTVGLYIIISVSSRGITLIWDKHTRITVELDAYWRNKVCGLCGNFDSNEMNDLQISGSGVVSSPMMFGNSWKAATPPCSDVTTEIFPCERNSYCSAWAHRRCMILTGDTFKECHLKVDPEPYYHACVQESCSCEFEGKFLGFCTAVAAYAEACSDQDVCVNWRTPDLCPVYCDYYNEQGQCSWHYDACGEMLTCGKSNYFTHKLEGCYPRCTREAPYYDENTGECTKLRNCTCYFNDTVIQPGEVMLIQSIVCRCENGTIKCPLLPTPTPATTALTTTETTVLSTTFAPTTITSATTETTTLPTSSTPSTTTTSITTETTVLSTTSAATTVTTAETQSTAPPPILTSATTMTTGTTAPPTTSTATTTTTASATTEITAPPTTSTPATTSTTEKTTPLRTLTPTTTTSATIKTTAPTTTTPATTEKTATPSTWTPTTTTSATTKTTAPPITSTRTTTRTLPTTEITAPPTTSTATTTAATETTAPPTTSTATTTTTVSATTETTASPTTSAATTLTPTTSATTSTTTETTAPPITSTAITTTSATTEKTSPLRTSTPTTTTSATIKTTAPTSTQTTQPTTKHTVPPTTSTTTTTRTLPTTEITASPTTSTPATTSTTETTAPHTTSIATTTTTASPTTSTATTASATTETTASPTTSTATTASATTETTASPTTSTATTASATTETTASPTTSTQTTTTTTPATTEKTTTPSTLTPTTTTSATNKTTAPPTTSTRTTTRTLPTTEITASPTTSTPATTAATETTAPPTTSTATTTTTVSATTETTASPTTSAATTLTPTTTTTTSTTTETTAPPITSTAITTTSATTEKTSPPRTLTPTTTTSATIKTTAPTSTQTTTTTTPATTEKTTTPSTWTPTTTTSATTKTTAPPTTSTRTTIRTLPTTEITVPPTTPAAKTTAATETTAPPTTSTATTTTTVSATTETTASPTTSAATTLTPTTSATTSTTTETTAPPITSTAITTTSATTEKTTPPRTSTPTTTTSATIKTTAPTSTQTTQPTTKHTVPPTTSTTTTTRTLPTTEITASPTTLTPATTSTTETTAPPTTSTATTTTTVSATTETTAPPITSTAITTTSATTEKTSPPRTLTPRTTTSATIKTTAPTSTQTTQPTTKHTVLTATALQSTTSFETPHAQVCECKDLKRKKTWSCGETWTEDCFSKTCTNGKIELTPVVCPEPTIPICPREQVTKVSDGCCDIWKCDCRCDLYGDPHYISFQGVPFDFLEECTYVLAEERSPRHHLTIAVDNFYCVPGLLGSCAKGIILKYQNNTATLDINPKLFAVQAALNNVTIEPPYEEQGLRFETTGYIVYIHLPDVRSYVSLSPSSTLVVSLAMEHFHNNTQGQCGVCGVGSCVRKGGQIEDDSCCDKTAYDWVYDDPLKPACVSAPRDVPCHRSTPVPTITAATTTSCPESELCELLHHPVFSNCSRYVNLILKKKNCKFDSCRNGACSALEQAAEECEKAGFCIDWRRLTNGSCNVTCPEGLVYEECRTKLDDFCYGGIRHLGVALEKNSTGCFCPNGLFRAGNHSNICVSDCPYCKGPLGEPKLPGEVWQSNCHLCTCNNQTRTEECSPKPRQLSPTCSPDAVLVNTSCCGDQICVGKTCSYHGKTYKVGDRWKDVAHPCMSFECSKEGVQTETRVCPTESCQEEDRIWDDEHCCFTCNQLCAPKVTSINITVDNCTAVMQMPVCQGQCASEPRVVFRGDLQVEQEYRSCQERSAEKRSVTLQCLNLTTRQYVYKHITGCECRHCAVLH